MKDNSIIKKTELDNCNFVKTMLMVIVVLYHCILFWSGGWFSEDPIYQNTIMPIISKWMNFFHISAFTLVSGYIYRYVRMERKGYNEFKIFISNKFKRLIVPYFFVGLLWMFPISTIFFKYSVKDLVFKLLLGCSPGHLWFILMLFVVFAIFYPLTNFIENYNFLTAVIVIVFWCASIVGNKFIDDYFQIFTALKFFSYFCVGYKLRQYAGKIKIKGYYVLILLSVHIIIFAVFYNIMETEGTIFIIARLVMDFILTQLGALTAFWGLQWIASHIKYSNKFYIEFEKRSMVVYLLHQPLIYISLYFFNGVVTPYLHAIINFTIAFGGSFFISILLLKFKITRFLIGEK